MKEDTKKTAPKSKVQIKDMAPKKDAKGGSAKLLAKGPTSVSGFQKEH